MALLSEDAGSKPGQVAAPGRRQLLTRAAAGLAIGAGIVAAGDVVTPRPAEAATAPTMVTILPSGDQSGATDAAAINGALSAGQAVQLVPGTYYVNATVQLPAGGVITGAGPQETLIQAVTGSALPAVIASAGWTASSNTSAQQPVYLSGFELNGNNAARHAIVSQNYWSYFQNLLVGYVSGDGLRLDSYGANGTTQITSSTGENRIEECQFRNCGGSGVRTNDSGGHYPDCYLIDCSVQGLGASGTAPTIQVDSAAGWLIAGCHVYGSPMGGILAGRAFATRIIGNYVESWGAINAANYYCGIDCGGLSLPIADDGRGSVISGNCLIFDFAPGNAGSYIDGISVQAASGSTGNVVIIGNSVGNTRARSTEFRGGLVLQAQNSSATLNAVTTGNLTGSGWNTPVDVITNGGTVNHTTGV